MAARHNTVNTVNQISRYSFHPQHFVDKYFSIQITVEKLRRQSIF